LVKHDKEGRDREKAPESPSIYISGLPMDITEEELGEDHTNTCDCAMIVLCTVSVRFHSSPRIRILIVLVAIPIIG
jgi:hypothetical protein